MMIYKHIRLAVIYMLAFIICMGIAAQNKQLTLNDLTPGGKTYSRFMPKKLSQLQWLGEGYVYTKGDSMIWGDNKAKEKVYLTLKDLNASLTAASLPSISSLPSFSVPKKGNPVIMFSSKGKHIYFDCEQKTVIATYDLEGTWANFEHSSTSYWLAFTKGNNIEILSREGEHRVVTNETAEHVVCGTSVHQNEFGISKGLFWSPDGTALAFYRMDESMVTDYPIVHTDGRYAVASPFKYPMAGMKSHEVTVGVYNIASNKTVWLKTGTPKDKYLTNIAWSPDGKSIYIAELNRDQNECNLVCYDAETGAKKAVLFTETNKRYVEPQTPALFIPTASDKFIWQSRRDGYNHLYLYDTGGKLLKQITKGDWIILDILGFDKKAQNIFVSATEGQGLEVNAWKVNINNGKRVCLTASGGVHTATLSPDAEYILDLHSSPTTPLDINLIQVNEGKEIAKLSSSKDPYAGYCMPDITIGQIKAADGKTDLNYRLTKPVGFDETKQYPTIVYVYGGPHVQLINASWMYGIRGWDIYMAQAGYVVFTVDSRGSANRGFEFESVIHRNLGVNEMADQIKGVEYLKSLPYVDSERIGVFGWSYGGFMTTNLMLTYPDVFKAGVAGGPVIDWSNYEIMYGERYMDHPKDNPQGYNNSNLKLKAGNLKGRLLMIHGAIDPVVVWQHSLGFLEACIDAGVFPDYFVYPTHKHNVIGKDRPHLMEKVTRYFEDNLK